MPHLEVLKRNLILQRPVSCEEVWVAWDAAIEHFGTDNCGALVAGWWQEQVHGAIVYLTPTPLSSRMDNGWLLTDSRRHRLRPLPTEQGAAAAVEFVPPDSQPVFHYNRADLACGSPLGFAPTRMLPGWDIVRCDNPARDRAYAELDPAPETRQAMHRTSCGIILERPGHTIEVDRFWHWLARQDGLVAERDIDAYALGWWQERDARGGPYRRYWKWLWESGWREQ